MKTFTYILILIFSSYSFAKKDISYLKEYDAFFIVKDRPMIFVLTKAKKEEVKHSSKTPERLPQTYKEVFKNEK